MDKDHSWIPIHADDDGFNIQVWYANNLGEEHVHATDFGNLDIRENSLHSLCWSQCSGDWPGCKMDCPLFTGPINGLLATWKEYEKLPPPDPFSFLLNHNCDIDDNNFYVEKFDTLDGTHWEIAVDVGDQFLDLLDVFVYAIIFTFQNSKKEDSGLSTR